MSTVEIRISEIKGFKKFFIHPGKQKEIPYYRVYIRRNYTNNSSDNMRTISFEYYDKARIYSNYAGHQPTLYDILDYIKTTFYITDMDQDLCVLTRSLEYKWSTDKIKREYPEFKEILETSEKLESVFSGIDMLTIPITLGCPHYDDYFDEIFVLEKEEEKQKKNEDKK